MAVVAKHLTLVANKVAEATITSANGVVEIVNRSGTAEIYFTIGGPSELPVAPTIEGDDCLVVPEALASYVTTRAPASAVVKLVSTGSPKVSVIGGQPT
jgi:hypothetical protein